MSRYIDAEELARKLNIAWKLMHAKRDFSIDFAMARVVTPLLIGTPTADVQEVVRCKDCKFREDGNGTQMNFCNCHDIAVFDNDFCSYGKRRKG